jgi:hypothetical protein
MRRAARSCRDVRGARDRRAQALAVAAALARPPGVLRPDLPGGRGLGLGPGCSTLIGQQPGRSAQRAPLPIAYQVVSLRRCNRKASDQPTTAPTCRCPAESTPVRPAGPWPAPRRPPPACSSRPVVASRSRSTADSIGAGTTPSGTLRRSQLACGTRSTWTPCPPSGSR